MKKSTRYDYNLPSALPGFANLAHPNMTSRNYINPTYYTKVMTKYCKLENTKAAGATGGVAPVIRRSINMKIRFPKHVLRPDVQEDEAFHNVIDPKRQYWLIVSTSQDATPITMNSRRWIVFRDSHGTAA